MTGQELDTLIDSLVEELAVPVVQLVMDDPWLETLCGPLPALPSWSPQTVALVAEYEARTGGAR
nr:hypothetical protein KitaXyl93_20320 [Kitasatospora sp. Xyl93]